MFGARALDAATATGIFLASLQLVCRQPEQPRHGAALLVHWHFGVIAHTACPDADQRRGAHCLAPATGEFLGADPRIAPLADLEKGLCELQPSFALDDNEAIGSQPIATGSRQRGCDESSEF